MPRKAMLRSGAAKYVIYVFNERSCSVFKGTFEHPITASAVPTRLVGWRARPGREKPVRIRVQVHRFDEFHPSRKGSCVCFGRLRARSVEPSFDDPYQGIGLFWTPMSTRTRQCCVPPGACFDRQLHSFTKLRPLPGGALNASEGHVAQRGS